MAARTVIDDVGTEVPIAASRRVVSLVPSLTETIAYESPEAVVGCTDWCTHPPGLRATRIGGTKWPRIDDIVRLAPDVVIANAEENREEDIAALRQAGLSVYVTAPATVAEAFESLPRMLRALALPVSAWIDTAMGQLARPVPQLAGKTVACFIWRRPWMVIGSNTFAGDMLARLGLRNVFDGHDERYPRISPDELPPDLDLVVLPDEPYRFTASDGPEAFPRRRAALISGRHLTWYGPSMVEARAVLSAALMSPVSAL